jgi:PAS domain S-box-containing protein
VDANAMMEALFGYSHAELIGAPVETLLPESLRAPHIGHRAGYALQPHSRPMGRGMDLVARRKDGSEFPVEISLSYVAEHQGGLAMAFVSDITARKQASQEREGLIGQLEGALAEKIVLLKEVHHRVKNNLAVIAGLLGMQADSLEDERARISLEESQQRVQSMALIHEYLYANEHLDRVNFGQYIEQLARELCVTYAVESDRIGIAVEAEEIEVSVHRAIPCGLILNELLSNALKYAFADGRTGEIRVHFARVESGELSLLCQDNGVGIPQNLDWQNAPSLGLKIVRILAKQIDGHLTLDRSAGGTRWELRFLPAAAIVR